MIYLDTNMFVSAAAGDEAAKNILLEVATGKLDGATSCLTWDEFVWVMRKEFGREEVLKESKRLIAFPRLTFLDVDPQTLEQAHDLTEKYGLKPRDALHAACATQNRITQMISDDADFDRVKEIRRTPIVEYRS
mgnify:CR=1 FL=1